MRPDLENVPSKAASNVHRFPLKLVKERSSVSLGRQIQLEPSPRSNKSREGKFDGAFSPQERRHNFAVARLPKLARFKAQAYLYTCLRCKYVFRVNDPAGSIVPLGPDGEALTEPVRSQCIQAFADGPCPSFRFGLELPVHRGS
jgi:hypothetical protein